MLSVLGVAVSSAVLVGYGVWTRRTGRVPRAPRRTLASWMGASVLMLCLSAVAAFAQESGASAGTATGMGFIGAALSTALVIFLTGRSGSPVRLVLMGMGISALFSALTMLAIYGAKDEAQVRSAMFWLMGSLTGIQWKAVPVMAAALAALMLFIWLLRHELDILLLGKEEARHLGMSVMRLQRLIVLFSSAVVAIVVALSGIIGFVGLIIPHAARFFSEPKHGVLLWFTALFGGIVLIWADVLARSAFRPEELPIGILTAGLGAPVFLWIISRKYGGY